MAANGGFSSYLKFFRVKAGLTQPELANAIGVQAQTVWRWEHGEREPSLDVIKKLCGVLCCTESELLNGPRNDKIELVISWNWEDTENDTGENKLKLVVSDDGKTGITAWECLRAPEH